MMPAMTYGTGTPSVNESQRKTMNVAEMRMLRWILGVTQMDSIRTERIR